MCRTKEDLEFEIQVVKDILECGGYNWIITDHLNLLQEQLASLGGDNA